jgi:hypothetical protein
MRADPWRCQARRGLSTTKIGRVVNINQDVVSLISIRIMCSWVFGLLGQPAVADDIVDPLLDLRCKRATLSRRELAHVDRGKSSRHDRTDVAHALAQRLVGEPLLALVEPQLLHRRGVTVIRMRSGRQRASREACETNDEQGRCKPFALRYHSRSP